MNKKYPDDMIDCPQFRQFCDDLQNAGHAVSVDKGFPFVHCVDPEYLATRTSVETDSFEEASEAGNYCLYPVHPEGVVHAH